MTEGARYLRQILLAEIGEAGQARLSSSDAALEGVGLEHEVAVRYARGAGLRCVPGPIGNTVLASDFVKTPAAGSVLAGSRAALASMRDALGLPRSPMKQSLFRSRRLRSVIDQIGQTPILRLDRIGKAAPSVEIYAKLEFANPGGSVKDRPALRMMLDAIEDGRLTDDKILIDSTSGNTGVAYSLIGAALGYRVELVMPSNVSQPRKDIVRAFGTTIIYSDPMEGSDGAILLARDMVAKNPERYFYPDQYSNPSNPRAHYLGTGREILDALGDRITHFVTGLGTTGSMMGTTRRLKEHSRPIRCIAVEPDDALHGLEGLKHLPSSLVPEIYDSSVPDEIMAVRTEDGWNMADRLACEEGLHVGHSSGANIFAALQIAEQLHRESRGGCVVTLVCDRGDRYFAPSKWEKRYAW